MNIKKLLKKYIIFKNKSQIITITNIYYLNISKY